MIKYRFLSAVIALIGAAVVTAGPAGPRAPQRLEVVGDTFFAVQVPDDAAAAEWYAATLGLEEVNHLEAADGRYSIRILAGERLAVELIRLRDAAEAADPHLGIFKAGFYVDDIEAAFEWLRGHGVDTDNAIFTDESLRARSFVFRDPYGNRIQVFERVADIRHERPS